MLMKNNNLIAVHGKIGHGKDTIGNIIQILTALPHLTDEGVESFLGREIDSPYKIKKFANKLKDMVCLLIGCTREQLEDREFKEKELGEEWWYYKPSDTMYPYLEFKQHEDQHHGININSEDLIKLTPRLILQLLGTEAGRNIIHPNIWVNALFADYKTKKIDIPFGSGTRTEKFKPNWIITDLRFSNEFEAVKDRGGITIKVNRFKEGDKVYWTDPDTTEFPEGANSGVYSIVKIYNEFCLLSNDVGSATEVPYDEIKPYIEKEHESETALDNETRWDYVINNDFTIEDLIKKVREILNKENII